jgi:hypothetical protein
MTIHLGRKIGRIRELLGVKQETLTQIKAFTVICLKTKYLDSLSDSQCAAFFYSHDPEVFLSIQSTRL